MQNHEEARLDALHQLGLLDTAPSESFDRITRMASQIFGLPIAAVSLTDRDRQWFKSRVGVEHQSIPRDKAPCAAVAESASTVLIPDLLADTFYADSVLAGQGIRFYAGASLTTRDGFSLGALCVLGTEPRTATPAEMAALHDLAQMVMAQIELQHAFGRIDPLSGLPNRTQFLDDLADLGRDTPGRPRLAVLVDLARGEQLNNGVRAMGSAYVDAMVRDAARALRTLLGPDRTAYHVAATQFAFLAPDGVDEGRYVEQLGALVHRLRARSSVQFVMTTSVGVAPFVTGETPPETVLRTMHSAALDARALETPVSLYSTAQDSLHQRRFRLLADFGAALEQPSQLRLVFQPRIDLATRRCVGAEALLRWTHPELGEISPAEFIPIVEQTSLARPTTARVLDIGLAQLGAWSAAGIDIKLSINVSAANLAESDFAQQVELHLLRHRVAPRLLELEVTESAIMDDAGTATAQLAMLDEAGIRLAIDDFGTGYSSLAYLQRLPASVVKIDQSFVRDLCRGERERTLVRSMIALSHGLGYRVVAEGVETAEMVGILMAMGCDEAQGYFFARPMEASDFERWFAGGDPALQAA
ncbi:putative bifunctional diguanylate cyclase/phosphodiesterase [Sphingomonas hengshuiensis]|uniref:Diguanylate phosphodiesterase n=1 Tax=Sphingomonas hengshuiensis TaxID=1609977 RepID=A0A7U5BE66_9SPHN|nr:EAL domain-containing protein [Sphingomonas hengshuiensis]AJP70629.1 diguanylate phosphodiesterase [Sphingomonas hengshuiensis]